MQENSTEVLQELPELNKKSHTKTYLISFGLVLFVLFIDQWLKVWVKTNMVLTQEINMIGDWFILHFTENNGMAFGVEFEGKYGKLILTTFRILAVTGITIFMINQIKKSAHFGFIISVSLILAGALGNIIDSVFYGIIYDYAPVFHGRVVDMLYFPILEGNYPEWIPYLGGKDFVFFRPVFNLADAAISIGVISIIIFQRKFFKQPENESTEELPVSESNSESVQS